MRSICKALLCRLHCCVNCHEWRWRLLHVFTFNMLTCIDGVGINIILKVLLHYFVLLCLLWYPTAEFGMYDQGRSSLMRANKWVAGSYIVKILWPSVDVLTLKIAFTKLLLVQPQSLHWLGVFLTNVMKRELIIFYRGDWYTDYFDIGWWDFCLKNHHYVPHFDSHTNVLIIQGIYFLVPIPHFGHLACNYIDKK